jgi:hypothetical protein
MALSPDEQHRGTTRGDGPLHVSLAVDRSEASLKARQEPAQDAPVYKTMNIYVQAVSLSGALPTSTTGILQ